MESRRGINAFLVLLCGLLLLVKYSSGNSLSRNELFARDTCTYTQGSTSSSRYDAGTDAVFLVEAGDGCYAVAARCGVSQSDLESFNGGADFCSTLEVGQVRSELEPYVSLSR